MLVTLSGIFIDVRPEQSEKAEEPMLVTLSGMTVFLHPATRVFVAVHIIALQLLRLSYIGLSDATMMDVKPEQPLKAELLMLVTLLGIFIDVRPVQSLNVSISMLVKLSGRVMEVRPEQPLKASQPMLLTLLGIVMDVRPVQ